MSNLLELPNIASKLESQLINVGIETAEELINVGIETAEELINVGIETAEELRRVGSREAWLRIRMVDPSACIMRLSALEGAIRGVRWHCLDSETKASLKKFYNENK